MKRKTGTREWASETANCFVGCEHNCRYCYAREMAIRFSAARWKKATELQKFGDVPLMRVTRENWSRPRLNIAAMSRRWTKRPGVIMFPSTHDITPANVLGCGSFLAEILKPGNRVLIVSKPHAGVIDYLCKLLKPWRGQIEFRFTIGAEDDALLEYWEPHAPGYDERMAAADIACANDHPVSFSIEPMLDPMNVVPFVHNLENWKPETIWLGKMNQIHRRVAINCDFDYLMIERIQASQTDDRIMAIVEALKDDPLIRWKDSIQEVIDRKGETR